MSLPERNGTQVRSARRILAAVRVEVKRLLSSLEQDTDWAVVTQTSPLMVRLDDDPVAQTVSAFAGLSPSVGDTVGLVKFGIRWYVVGVLKEA